MQTNRSPLDDAYLEFGLASRRDEPQPFGRFHRHNEIELVYLECGRVEYLLSAGRVTVPTGIWAVFWGAMPHQIVAVDPGTVEHWLTVPLAWFLAWRLPPTFVDRLMAGAVLTAAGSEGAPVAAEGLALIQRWHGDLRAADAGRRTIVLLEAEALLRRVALAAIDLRPVAGGPGAEGAGTESRASSGPVAGGVPTPGGLAHVEVMAQFIARHYIEPLRVAQIAAAAQLHPEYATTIFRQACGRSLMAYLTEHRISHAQRLLATTDRKILDIALASGFQSPSRFYAVFEAHCGCAPKVYRRRVQAAALTDA